MLHHFNSKRIAFNFDENNPNLKSKLIALNHIHNFRLRLIANNLSIHDLEEEFKLLASINHLEYREQLLIEQYKLMIMRAVTASLQPVKVTEKTAPAKQNYLAWVMFFAFLILLQLIPGFIIGYYGTAELLIGIFPGIPVALAEVSSILATTVDCFLEVVVSTILIRMGLNANYALKTNLLLKTYEEQLNTVDEINELLKKSDCYEQLCCVNYRSFMNLTTCFNRNISALDVPKFSEPMAKRILRYMTNSISTGSLVCGGIYFLNNTVLTIVFSSLAFTPIGWTIAGLFVASMLTLRYFTKTNNLYDLFNPSAKQHVEMRENITHFRIKKPIIERDLQAINQQKIKLHAQAEQIREQEARLREMKQHKQESKQITASSLMSNLLSVFSVCRSNSRPRIALKTPSPVQYYSTSELAY
ncbi:hypothetical protein BH10PSE19_BH10PSE19_06050 [soil metagenome]